VTTVIRANRAYRILQVEMLRAGSGAGGAAARALTELADPAPDWVKLASGMGVPAERATDADSLGPGARPRARRAGAEPRRGDPDLTVTAMGARLPPWRAAA
jgi:acetolactate synthase-1/2/3 large subunit